MLPDELAKMIWTEEQKINQVLQAQPTDPHLNGVLRGLQRARDIVLGRVSVEEQW